VNWTEVVNKSGQTSPQLYDFTFTPVRARYIKVHDISSTYPGNPGWNYAYSSGLEAYEMGSGTNAVVEKQYDYTYDASGRVSKVTGTLMGATAPAVVVDAATPSLINVNTLTVNYTVNGIAKQQTFSGLVQGANKLAITETDLQGNQTTVYVFVTRSELRGVEQGIGRISQDRGT